MAEFKVIAMRAHSLLMESPKGERAYASRRVANILLQNPNAPYEIQEVPSMIEHRPDSDRYGQPQLWFATFSRF